MARSFQLDRDEAELLVDLLDRYGDKGNHLVPQLIAALCQEFGMGVRKLERMFCGRCNWRAEPGIAMKSECPNCKARLMVEESEATFQGKRIWFDKPEPEHG